MNAPSDGWFNRESAWRLPGRSGELTRIRRLIRAKARAGIRLDAARQRLVRDLETGGEPEAGKAVNAMLDGCLGNVDGFLGRVISALLDSLQKAPPRCSRPRGARPSTTQRVSHD